MLPQLVVGQSAGSRDGLKVIAEHGPLACRGPLVVERPLNLNIINVNLRQLSVFDRVKAMLDDAAPYQRRELVAVLACQPAPHVASIHQSVRKRKSRCEASIEPNADAVPLGAIG